MLRCPSCREVGIDVMAEVALQLSVSPDGTILWDPPQRQTEYAWSGDSTAVCTTCGWVGLYQEAYVFNQEVD